MQQIAPMQPDTSDNEPRTAQGLADLLGKSREGVRKAIIRLGIQPLHKLGGVRYYDTGKALPLLTQEMRDYNRKTSAPA